MEKSNKSSKYSVGFLMVLTVSAIIILSGLFSLVSCVSNGTKVKGVTPDNSEEPPALLLNEEDFEYFLYRYKEDGEVQDDLLEKDTYIYKQKIAEVSGLSEEEAADVFYWISFFAEKYSIALEDGLLIVHTESDFHADAFNAGGNAYGLCQVTAPCLAEYNEVNGTSLNLETDMLDVRMNLDVGFWYYNRILTRYANAYGYITEGHEIRDAYIAYNVGVTTFASIGRTGRNLLRRGEAPDGSGLEYRPISRLTAIAKECYDLAV